MLRDDTIEFHQKFFSLLFYFPYKTYIHRFKIIKSNKSIILKYS